MTPFLLFYFALWHLLLFFSAFAGSSHFPFTPRFPYSDIYLFPSGLPFWIWAFANFDGVHYQTIAQFGYSAQFTQVFFPLFPIILGFWQRLFSPLSFILTGLIFSNLIF